MSRRAAIWALAAVLGIVITAAITWSTSRLTGQRIGLSSEPLSAGRSLAPSVARRRLDQRHARTATAMTVTRTMTSASTNGGGVSSTTTAVVTQTTVHASPSPPRSERARDDGGGGGRGSRERSGASHGSEGRGPDD